MRIIAKIQRTDKVIGFVIENNGSTKPCHINTVVKLAQRKQIQNAQLANGELQLTEEVATGEEVIKKYATANYTARKHPRKNEFWGWVHRHDEDTPTLVLVGTYRGKSDGLLGYKVFCPDSLDEYSLHLMETHQAIEDYHIIGGFSEPIKRGRTDWNWHLYFEKDVEYESIDALPRELLGKCEPPTGGHLERDDLFESWRFKEISEAIDKMFLEMLLKDIPRNNSE